MQNGWRALSREAFGGANGNPAVKIQLVVTLKDMKLFEEALKEKKLAVVLDEKFSSTGMPVPIDSSARRTTPEGIASSYYLVQPEPLKDLRTQEICGNWFADDGRSPVLAFEVGICPGLENRL